MTAPLPKGRDFLLHRQQPVDQVLINYPPKIQPSKLVNSLNGVSSQTLRSIRPEMKKLQNTYFVYIQADKKLTDNMSRTHIEN